MKGLKPPIGNSQLETVWWNGSSASNDENPYVKVRILPTTPVGCGGINGFHGPLADAPLSNRGGYEVCMPLAGVGSSPTIHTIFHLEV